jgi:hypothetical protein
MCLSIIYLSSFYLSIFIFSNYLYILGIITTISGNGSIGDSGDGGLATSATINNPLGVAIDHITGDVYFSDYNNHRIRLITNSSGNNYIYYNQIITNEIYITMYLYIYLFTFYLYIYTYLSISIYIYQYNYLYMFLNIFNISIYFLSISL